MVDAHHRETIERHVLDESAERILHRLESPEMIEMLGIDIGDDGDVGGKLEKRAVALVGLHDEPFTVVVGGVGADLVEVAADDEAGVPTRGPQDERQHRRRGRLAVTTGDGHGSMCGGERAQRVGAPEHRQAAFDGRADFGVRVGDGRRHDNRVGVGRHVLGAVSDVRAHVEQSESFEPA